MPREWLRQGRRSVRVRLTALYSGLFLLTGALLLALTYLLIANSTLALPEVATTGTGGQVQPLTELPVSAVQVVNGYVDSQLAAQRADVLSRLLVESGVALGIMALVSVFLGWLMAGRVLRPLRTMTTSVRHMSEDDLHERLDMQGPDDELKDLADTFDGLLARLETAFEAQRMFVANASHELRTPLALERALVEVALADPEPTVESLRSTYQRVLANSQHQERLIEAMLTLARGQRGVESRQVIDLAVISRELVGARHEEAETRGLRVEMALEPTFVSGDPHLVERLVANLVDNALRHNVVGGWVRVWVGTHAARPTLRVINSGSVVRPDQVDELFQPFRRLRTERGARQRGLGLGLSIVAAIATAHGGQATARPVPGGGLQIDAVFPAP